MTMFPLLTTTTHSTGRVWNHVVLSPTLLRLVITCWIIGFVPGIHWNTVKTMCLFLWWSFSFQFNIRMYELCFCMCFNLLFIALNYNALSKGLFQFKSNDFFLQPLYECFMWGFYVLHAMRCLGDEPPELKQGEEWQEVGVVGLSWLSFGLLFGVCENKWILSWVSLFLVVICLCMLHSGIQKDLQFILFFIGTGFCVEWTGLWCGEWKYPENQLISNKFIGNKEKFQIPLWFIGMWGGIGFFLYRGALPLMWWVMRWLQKQQQQQHD